MSDAQFVDVGADGLPTINTTGFGQIVGKLTVTNADRTTTSYGFILTPVAYP